MLNPEDGKNLGALPGKGLCLALCVLWAIGCSKAENPSTNATAAGLTPAAVMVTSIPFGELNIDEEYNASDVVALADSRFLFCDNNANDALFELNLTPEGQKKGPLIRRPL